MTSKACNPTCL